MDRAQESIVKWIYTQFEKGAVRITPLDGSKVQIRDPNGEEMTFTCNLFIDIMDAETGDILAVSNLPHDLRRIGYQMPTSWENIPYSESRAR